MMCIRLKYTAVCMVTGLMMLVLVSTACAYGAPPATIVDADVGQLQLEQKSDNISQSDNVTLKKGIKGFSEKAAAPDFRLTTINGETFSPGKLRGSKVLLNFWATWCNPCKREMPYLEYYFKQNVRTDLLIMAICSDSSTLSVNTFITQLALTLPVLLDTDGKVRRLYSNEKNKLLVLPTTFLIDEQGIIVKILRHQFNGIEDIENRLKSAGF